MTPGTFIEELRSHRKDSVVAYTEGDCYKLYKLLKLVWPEAEAWYDFVKGHVLTQIGQTFYDIKGEVVPPSVHFIPLKEEPHIAEQAPFWSYQPKS